MATLDELVRAASTSQSPALVSKIDVKVGGVDPLGLRQINFDLMDKIFPGLNNVADKLRPFVLMTWAWRRVKVIIERDNLGGATDEQIRDFVDRIEAIYSWSQFLLDRNAEIPGGQALFDLIHGGSDTYHFGGRDWEKRRDLRRTSTGLSSPLNYGPGLRSMGWLIPAGPPGVFQANFMFESMLDSFEENFKGELSHPAFNKLGAVEVDRADVRRWGRLWALSDVTEVERLAGFDRLAGPHANHLRRDGVAMLEVAVHNLGANEPEVAVLREMMAEPPIEWLDNSALVPRADAWRRLQIRQLFRLALEGLFYWILRELRGRPVSTQGLATRFANQASLDGEQSTEHWLSSAARGNTVQRLHYLEEVLSSPERSAVPAAIAASLQFCLDTGRNEQWDKGEAFDRLSLVRALKETNDWKLLPLERFIGRVLEVWVIAQHAYWCVGRGLADARGHRKTLLRLRIVIDDGGWTLTPGANVNGFPVPTLDRLHTAVSLLKECGRLPSPIVSPV